MNTSRKRQAPEASSLQHSQQDQQQQHEQQTTEGSSELLPSERPKQHHKVDASLYLSLTSQQHPSAFPIIRRLKVPQTEDELDSLLEDAYCDNDDDIHAEASSMKFTFLGGTRMPRPLPASHILAATALIPKERPLPRDDDIDSNNQDNKHHNNKKNHHHHHQAKIIKSNPFLNMPLLQDFFKAMGKELPSLNQQQQHDDTLDDNPSDTTALVDDIDNPRLSTLTRGQHERFLKLVRDHPHITTHHHHHLWTNELQRKEFQKLSLVVQTEQARYRQAVLEFIQTHKKRFCLGFVGNDQQQQNNDDADRCAQGFTTVVSRHVELYRQAWEQQQQQPASSSSSSSPPSSPSRANNSLARTTNTPSPPPHSYLHQCCQRITIPRKARDQPHRHHKNNQQLLLEAIECQVVHRTTTIDNNDSNTTTDPTTTHRLEQILRHTHPNIRLPKPKLQYVPPVHLLRYDDKGLELCDQYHANILTCVETLTTLLQLPTTEQQQHFSFRIPIVTRCKSSVCSDSSSHHHRSGKRSKLLVVHCLELPLPQPCTSPRECLTRGYQEGLDQHVASTTTTAEGPQQPPPPYVYTLVTLPSAVATTTKLPLRMIVRSTDRLVMSQSISNDNMNHHSEPTTSLIPITLQASLEYFCGTTFHSGNSNNNNNHNSSSPPPRFRPRPWELSSSWEKACWILDQKLHQPRGGRIYVARIDPATARLVALEEKSVAHALAGNQPLLLPHTNHNSKQQDVVGPTAEEQQQQQQPLVGMNNNHQEEDPLVHWQALLDILQAIPTIREGEHVLCFPDAERSSSTVVSTTSAVTLSVHPAMTTTTTTTTTGTTNGDNQDDEAITANNAWHVPSWLEQANRVYLGDAAIRQSFRNWNWEQSDRVPYTFPCSP